MDAATAPDRSAARRCLKLLVQDAPVTSRDGKWTQFLSVGTPWWVGWPDRSVLRTEGSQGPGRFRTFRVQRERMSNSIGSAAPFEPRFVEHWKILDGTVVRSATDRYESRRTEWGDEFVRLLKDIAPYFTEDAIAILVVDPENFVRGTIRLIAAPYGWKDGAVVAAGPTVRAMGYREDAGFRPPALPALRGGEAPLFESLTNKPRPRRWLPGEEILGKENGGFEAPRPEPLGTPDRNGVRGGVAWELTSFFVDETLPPDERLQIWTQLTLAAAQELFWGSNRFNYSDQFLFTYGTGNSVRLYAPFGAEKLRQYRRSGLVVGPDAFGFAPPVVAFHREWWTLEIPLVRMEQYALGVSGGEGRFAAVDASAQLAAMTGNYRPWHMLWSPKAVFQRGSTLLDFHLLAQTHVQLGRVDDPLRARRSQWAVEKTTPLLNDVRDELLRRLSSGSRSERTHAADDLRTRFQLTPELTLSDGKNVIEALVRAAVSDSDLEVRGKAYNAVAAYGAAGVPYLAAIAAGLRTTNLELRRTIARAVGQLCVHGASPSGETMAVIVDAIDDEDDCVAANALLALRFAAPKDDRIATRIWNRVRHPTGRLHRPDAELVWVFGPPLEVGWVHAAAAYRRARNGGPGSLDGLALVLASGPRDFAVQVADELLSTAYGDQTLAEGLEHVVSWLERDTGERGYLDHRSAHLFRVAAPLAKNPAMKRRLLDVLDRWATKLFSVSFDIQAAREVLVR